MNAWMTEQIAHEQIADRQRAAAERSEVRGDRSGHLLASIGQLAAWARVPALAAHRRAVGTSLRRAPTTMGCNA